MNFSFVIHGRLAGANEVKSSNRAHWAIGAKLVKEQRELCENWIRMYPPVHFENPVSITFKWYEKNKRRDPDNVMSAQKYVLDSLVKLQVLKNDTQRYIYSLSHSFYVDEKDPRVWVNIEEVGNE